MVGGAAPTNIFEKWGHAPRVAHAPEKRGAGTGAPDRFWPPGSFKTPPGKAKYFFRRRKRRLFSYFEGFFVNFAFKVDISAKIINKTVIELKNTGI